MSQAAPGGGSNALPGWVSSLQVLAPVAGTLATVATNPEDWLERFVFDLIAEWVVGGILGAAEYGLGWVFFAFERTADILLTAVPVLETPTEVAGDVVTGAISTIFEAVRGIATTAGLAGPAASALTIVVLFSIVLALGLAVWRVIPGTEAIDAGIGVFS